MAKIEKIEDIVAWQNAIKLCDAIYEATDKTFFSKDYSKFISYLRETIKLSKPSKLS